MNHDSLVISQALTFFFSPRSQHPHDPSQPLVKCGLVPQAKLTSPLSCVTPHIPTALCAFWDILVFYVTQN